MTYQLSGVIRGNMIELVNNPGLIDGQQVDIVVKPTSIDPNINPKTHRPWGEGFLRTAGAFADDPNADRIIEEILAERKMDTRRGIEE